MAQFDVHHNPAARKAIIPFVVVVQSQRLDRSKRRIVLPLVARQVLPQIDEPRLNPSFLVLGQSVLLDPLQIVSIPVDHLGISIGSLAERGDDIVAALDLVFTQAYG